MVSLCDFAEGYGFGDLEVLPDYPYFLVLLDYAGYFWSQFRKSPGFGIYSQLLLGIDID